MSQYGLPSNEDIGFFCLTFIVVCLVIGVFIGWLIWGAR